MSEYEQAEREIYASILRRNPEHDFVPTLDRVRAAVELLGDPQRSYQVVHVAGTNGKTSTSRMIESLVREHGLRTGLFTSPHLVSVRERIQLDGEPITSQRFVEAYQEIEPILDLVDERSLASGGPRLSFFEVLTVLAFAVFADAPVDVAVIEVGLGGTFDATNVVASAVQVITPISLDHQRWLGSTVTEIAGEKAGIIRDRVVVGRQTAEAAAVLADVAADAGALVAWEDRDFAVVAREIAVGGQMLDIRGLGGVYREIFLPLFGEHQGENAATALVATELLLAETPTHTGGGAPAPGTVVLALDESTVREGFAQVTSPGRLEVVRSSPLVLVDGAHNPAGAEALVAGVREAFRFTRVIGVVGLMADKDAEAVLGEFEPLFDEVVVTQALSDRALPAEELGAIATEVFGEDRVRVEPRLDDALALAVDLAESAGDSDPAVLVTGSIALIGETRTLLGVSSAG